MMTFEEAHALAAPFTIVGADRCVVLWNEAKNAPPGHFAEVGVYNGGTAMLLRMAAPERQLHLFDTFAGHPDVVTPHDGQAHPAGRFNDTDVVSVLERVGGDTVGWVGRFPGLCDFATWSPPLALVHVDVDLYQSTRDVCDRLVPLIVPGGVLICDDYGFDDCPGAKKAIDEYAALVPDLVELTVSLTGQAILRRRA